MYVYSCMYPWRCTFSNDCNDPNDKYTCNYQSYIHKILQLIIVFVSNCLYPQYWNKAALIKQITFFMQQNFKHEYFYEVPDMYPTPDLFLVSIFAASVKTSLDRSLLRKTICLQRPYSWLEVYVSMLLNLLPRPPVLRNHVLMAIGWPSQWPLVWWLKRGSTAYSAGSSSYQCQGSYI